MKVRIVCLCVAFVLFSGLACDSKEKPKVDVDPKQKIEKAPTAPKLPPPPPKE